MFEVFGEMQELHLYLQLNFPALLFAKVPEGWDSKSYLPPFETAGSGEEDMPVIEWIQGIKAALRARQKDIGHFFTSEFSFPEALFSLVPLSGKDMGTWLALAHEQREEDLRYALLKASWPLHRPVAVFIHEEDKYPLTDLDEAVKEIVDKPALWTHYLRQAGLSAENSWTIFALVEKPHLFLRAFSALLMSFQFVSDAVVGSRETEAIESIRQNLHYLEQNQKKLGLLNEKVRFSPKEKGGTITLIPTIEPFALRNVESADKVLIGFAIPAFLKSKEKEEEEKRIARSNFCQILADPTRYNLCCLLAKGVKKQKDLAKYLGVSQGTISHHLSQLKSIGIVSEDRAANLAHDSIHGYLKGVAEDLQIYGH